MPSDIDDILVCDGFEGTAATKRHIIALAPAIPAARQLHHVTLLESDVAVSATPGPCAPEAMTARRPLYGWAPGTVDTDGLYDLDRVGVRYEVMKPGAPKRALKKSEYLYDGNQPGLHVEGTRSSRTSPPPTARRSSNT